MVKRRQLLTAIGATAGLAGLAGTTFPALAGCDNARRSSALTALTDEPGFTAPREATPYVGASLGYFKDAGIELTVRLSDPRTSVTDLVAGHAHIVDADATTILQQIAPPPGSNVAPLKGIRVVGAMQKQCMFGVIFPTSHNWTGPDDLKGKTLGCAAGSAGQRLWPEYARRAGIDPTATTFITAPSSAQVPNLLASRRVDAVVTYLTDLHTYQVAVKQPVTAMAYSDFVLDLFGTLWVTRAELAERNPDLVSRAVAALFASVRYAVDHPADAAARVAKAYPTFAAPAATAVFEAMHDYTPTIADGPYIDTPHMARCIAALRGAGIIGATTPGTVLAPAAMPSPSGSAS